MYSLSLSRPMRAITALCTHLHMIRFVSAVLFYLPEVRSLCDLSGLCFTVSDVLVQGVECSEWAC